MPAESGESESKTGVWCYARPLSHPFRPLLTRFATTSQPPRAPSHSSFTTPTISHSQIPLFFFAMTSKAALRAASPHGKKQLRYTTSRRYTTPLEVHHASCCQQQQSPASTRCRSLFFSFSNVSRSHRSLSGVCVSFTHVSQLLAFAAAHERMRLLPPQPLPVTAFEYPPRTSGCMLRLHPPCACPVSVSAYHAHRRMVASSRLSGRGCAAPIGELVDAQVSLCLPGPPWRG